MKSSLKKVSILLSLLLVFVVISPFVLGNLGISSIDILEEERGKVASDVITITNNFADNFNNFKFLYTWTDFSDGENNITITFSNPETIDNGTSKDITITANIPKDIKLDTYKGIITINATNVTNSLKTISTTFTLQIDIRPAEVGEICEKGRKGLDDLEITDIKDPDDDEDFKPTEIINVKVKVYNHASKDMDVEFIAFLIDKEDDDVLSDTDKDTAEIEKHDDFTFELGLKVPADIEKESDSKYAVYVVANKEGNEDKYCDWQKVDIGIRKKSDDVVITRIDPKELVCGMVNDLFIKIVNAGTSDQDEVEVRLWAFGIAYSKKVYNLDEGDDTDVLFSLNLPKDIEAGRYDIEVITIDEDGDQNDREIFKVDVTCAAPKTSASLTLSQTSFTTRKDSMITMNAVITNTGDAEQEFTLKVTPSGDWADASETSFTLAKGASKTEILNLLVKQEGTHFANVQVFAVGNPVPVATQSISVDARSITGQVVAQQVSSQALREQLPLLITVGVLGLAIIILIIWLIVLYARKASIRTERGLNEIKNAVRGRTRTNRRRR